MFTTSIFEALAAMRALLGTSAEPGCEAVDSTSKEPLQDNVTESLCSIKPRSAALGVDQEAMFIALMGVTGAGKSSFIDLCSREKVLVGHGLQACMGHPIIKLIDYTYKPSGTKQVAVYPCDLDSTRKLYLVDTPGFDDTHRSDTEVLQEMAAWLTESYERNIKLRGIIYIHRITDTKMSGSALKNLNLFQKLCGDDALKNVLLVTSRWEELASLQQGESRLRELEESPAFWKTMKAWGSRVCKHWNTQESALNILGHFTDHGTQDVILALQTQMVVDGKTLDKTSVGIVLSGALETKEKVIQSELAGLDIAMDSTLKHHDESTAVMVERQRDETNQRLQSLDKAREDLRVSLEKLHQERFNRLEESLKTARLDSLKINEALKLQREQQVADREKAAKQKADADAQILRHSQQMEDLRLRLLRSGSSCRDGNEPGMISMDAWTTHMTLSRQFYSFTFHTLDIWRGPPGFPKSSAGNRFVAFGEEGSWFRHYHDEFDDCLNDWSPNLQIVYPSFGEDLRTRLELGCPTCVSLGTNGDYFFRANRESRGKLSSHLAEKLDEIEQLFLGQAGAYMAVMKDGSWHWCPNGQYKALENELRKAQGDGLAIKCLAMNLYHGDSAMAIFTGPTNRAWYSDPEENFKSIDFMDYCETNFGLKFDAPE